VEPELLDRRMRDSTLRTLEAALGAEELDRLQALGRELSAEETVALGANIADSATTRT
jgi:hypothetical protein